MQIITCTNEHLHQMLSILNEVIEHTTSNYDYEPKSEHELRQWLKEKQDCGYPVLGILDEYGFLEYPHALTPSFAYSAPPVAV
ncbi:MAG: hypothetical protein EOM32_10100 [Spirochaetia bacterium]|nr:hypothetical protein [Spirochaetia bacterium]